MISERDPIRNIETCGAQVRIFTFPVKFQREFLRGQLQLANMPGDGDPIHTHQVGSEVCVLVYSASFKPYDRKGAIPKITARLVRREEGRMAA